MRTGRGFTYLGMLFFVAITAAALAALGQSWQTAVQREKERELAFRGQEIARAIDGYLRVGVPAEPGAAAAQGDPATRAGAYPRSLADLLSDGRGPKPRHHLRRAYADPFTGKADWVLVAAPGDPAGFHGVHSRSETLLLRRLDPDSDTPSRALDWVFIAGQDPARPDPAASAASAAAEP
jgi:type II secretory pathway pseudopilin PulG